jgi:hypothetical protein
MRKPRALSRGNTTFGLIFSHKYSEFPFSGGPFTLVAHESQKATLMASGTEAAKPIPPLWQRAPGFWMLATVLLGLGLRCFHYLRNPSVWHDEAALLVNVLEKNFGDLLGTLYWAEAAPPLFLWLERAVALLLNDGVYPLRLLPFVASCWSVLLVQSLARRLLAPAAAVWAVLLFATSDTLLWHACEAKPYAIDVFLAALVLTNHLRTQAWPVARQCLLHAALAPVLIFLSYPGAFLCGASLLALLPALWRQRCPRNWLAYGLWTGCVFGAFALLLLGPARAQRCADLYTCWGESGFADWSRPWSVPLWTLVGTVEVLRYCFKPAGQPLLLPALVGALALWRQGRRQLVVLLVTPLALACVAAWLHQYPYGPIRLEVYAAPALALLIGAGIFPLCAWLRARQRWLALPVFALLAATPLFGLYGVIHPWSRPDCAAATQYILDHWQVHDVAVGNKWEYVYYFRDFKDRFVLHETCPQLHPEFLRVASVSELSEPARCWYVFSGICESRGMQAPTGDEFPGFRVLAQQEFEATRILLLERR